VGIDRNEIIKWNGFEKLHSHFHSLFKVLNMRKLFLFAIFLIGCACASAQTVDFSKARKPAKSDTIAKKILEQTKYTVLYDYTYVRDAEMPEDTRNTLTVLQIGDNYNRFVDYYALRYDSLIDATVKNQLSMAETGSTMLATLRKVRFNEGILIDKNKNKETVQRTAGLSQKYQYEEDCPALDWELLEGDTLIAGYHCNKARTSLFGRDYVAWYSPEISMPYGPYKFNGLPGLVVKVNDTANNFEFVLCGLKKQTDYSPIYLWANRSIIKTSRDKVRKIYKNYCADPVGALTSSGKVQISEETRASVKSKPYNPIEIE